MVFPSVQYARSDTSSSTVYRYGNEVVKFSGSQSYIGFGNSLYPVSWNIYEINPGAIFAPLTNGSASLLMKEKFNNTITKRVQNGLQDSAVMVRWNNNVKIAEIFSFINGGIDASIAVQNLLTRNATYVTTFLLKTNHNDRAYENGYSGGTVIFPASSKAIFAPIVSGAWSIDDQHITISWESEMSLFHGGMMESTNLSNMESLPFGPFTLSPNETYSIDPRISPDLIVGGGGGGGPVPPEVSLSVGSYNNTIAGGTAITLKADVYNSGGSLNNGVEIYAITSYDGQQSLLSIGGKNVGATGSYTVTWSTTPGNYTGFEAVATGTGGSTTVQAGHAFGAYTSFPYLDANGILVNPDESQQTSAMYDSSGDLVGYMSIQMKATSADFSSTGISTLTFESSFLPVNMSAKITVGQWKTFGGVNQYSQTFSWIGNSIGKTPTDGSWISNIFESAGYQSASNDTWTIAEKMLWSALEAGLALSGIPTAEIGSLVMATLYPLAFSGDPDSLDVIGNGPYSAMSVGFNAGTNNGFLNFIGNSANNDSWFFSFYEQLDWYNQGNGISSTYTVNNAILNYFTYSGNFTVAWDSYLSPLYSGSTSEPIYIAEYAG
ncbi:MAG: hypothetical protein ACYDAZ_01925 [Thermoplasmataceae archaeon]